MLKPLSAVNLIKIILLIAGYIFTAMMMSRFIDADLGWHLRFGQEWWQNNSFPYLDTYTWTNYGKLWINHEWGGDILFWFIYNYFGYVGLVLIMALALFSAFLLVARIFQKKLTILSLSIILVLLWLAQHVLAMRLAMLAPLFLALLWYSLERLPEKRAYYVWPIFFWLWSVLHGSWILGFIVIGIYVAGHSINLVFKKYAPRFYQFPGWTGKNILNVLFWAGLAAALILVNPYGFGLWREVVAYFFTTYDKLNIADWLPSYAYPVNWEWLALMGASLPLAGWGFWRKKITWPQALLFAVFWYAAFRYKRQAIFFAMIVTPLFVSVVEETRILWSRWFQAKKYRYFLATALFLTLIFYGLKSAWPVDPWTNQWLMRQTSYPLAAVNFLKNRTVNQSTRMFNDLNWGGYLNWSLPNITLFLDGRGASTWYVPNQPITYLEYYHQLLNDPGGLEIITKNKARYIFLSKTRTNYPTDPVNRWMFGKRLEVLRQKRSIRLEDDLSQSIDWQLIYEDELSRIWEDKRFKN